MLRQRRLGFLVDAALVGFSVGTGFALVENLEYLRTVNDERLILWLVRGFGPAILHGAMTALFAILVKSLSDRYPARGVLIVRPRWPCRWPSIPCSTTSRCRRSSRRACC